MEPNVYRGSRIVAGSAHLLCITVVALLIQRPVWAQNETSDFGEIAGPQFFNRPLEAADPSAASLREAVVLQQTIEATRGHDAVEVADLLDAFVAENPSSVWSPSLRANLAGYYLDEGRYTKALEHWQRAWADTKSHPLGPGKRVADYALTQWTRILAALGRTQELEAVLAETQGRVLDGGPMAQKFIRTREIFGLIRPFPSASYRCGWLTLSELSLKVRGRALQPSGAVELDNEQNLLRNSSMKNLAAVAAAQQWPITGVERPVGVPDLPWPSLIHLKEGHYVALLGEAGGFMRAYDPVFGHRWFRKEVLNAETSGRFLLPAEQVPSGWRVLSEQEMATTVGPSIVIGPFSGMQDDNETWCDECTACPTGNPGSSGANGGNGGSPGKGHPASGASGAGSGLGCVGGCTAPTAIGMPQWSVSEPNINLWLRDVPIVCQTAYGPATQFQLNYKQRDEVAGSAYDVFGFGPAWNSPWLSWVDASQYAQTSVVFVHLPGGGKISFDLSGGPVATDYFYNARLTATMSGSDVVGFALDFPDGRQYRYEMPWQGGSFYMTRATDSQGFYQQFSYSTVMVGGNPQLRLVSLLDRDGVAIFSLAYVSQGSYHSLVSTVSDRFGRTAHLSYALDAYPTCIWFRSRTRQDL